MIRLGIWSATSVLAVGSLGLQPGGVQPPAGHPPVTQPAREAPPEPPPARPEDIGSIDAIVGAFYAATSAPAGQPRDWERLRSLFVPEARFIAARPGPEGSTSVWLLPVNDYVEFNRKYFEKGGYLENEVARRTEEFGNIAHVWSTYEARRDESDAGPYSRGIYSIQLLKDGARWWVVNVYWDFERPEAPIPEEYLQTPGK